MDFFVVAQIVVGLILLIGGGEFLVRGASSIAYSIQISPLVVGLTVVAFGTSAPELLISIQSALSGSPAITMGNVVGSNICNLSLVLGATAIFYPIVVSDNSIKVDWLMTMGSSLLLYFFISKDNYLTRFEGTIFVVILIVYTYFLIEMSRRETKEKLSLEAKEGIEAPPPISRKTLYLDILFLVLGCVGLFFGADWFVSGAKSVAEAFNVSEAIIGLTLVAIGTSLPELVTSAIAAYKKTTDLALGNLLGSSIFNVLSILGITSLIKEIKVSEEILNRDMIWMMGIILLVLPMMISRRRIGRVEGVILLIAYGTFMYMIMP